MSCWRRKSRWRPTSVARWPWRTIFSCKQADEIRFSITELVIDFIAPDGRAENLRMKAGPVAQALSYLPIGCIAPPCKRQGFAHTGIACGNVSRSPNVGYGYGG